jgi:hypothetical protein
MTRTRISAATLALIVLAAGCRAGKDGEAQAAVRVDSAVAVTRALADFRRTVPETRELGGRYAGNPDSLVARFVTALERSDSAAFMPMMMDRAEFAWLYYADDPQSRPPYELPPDIMWFQRMQQGEKGITRALQKFGGRPLAYRGYACADSATLGRNRVWRDCRLDVVDAAGERVKARLFGGIVERGGRYKILSYANEL